MKQITTIHKLGKSEKNKRTECPNKHGNFILESLYFAPNFYHYYALIAREVQNSNI